MTASMAAGSFVFAWTRGVGLGGSGAGVRGAARLRYA